jgi:hypothetical protein
LWCALSCAPAAAQSTDAFDVDSPDLQRLRGLGRHVAPARPAWAAQADMARSAGSDAMPRLSIVELPPEGLLPNARRHHALSIRLDGARETARGLGIDLAECAVQFRAPARIGRSAMGSVQGSVEIQAQVRLACRM